MSISDENDSYLNTDKLINQYNELNELPCFVYSLYQSGIYHEDIIIQIQSQIAKILDFKADSFKNIPELGPVELKWYKDDDVKGKLNTKLYNQDR